MTEMSDLSIYEKHDTVAQNLDAKKVLTCISAILCIITILGHVEKISGVCFSGYSRVFHKHTRLAMLALLPTLYSCIFVVFIFIYIHWH